jgi:hypothetical protein
VALTPAQPIAAVRQELVNNAQVLMSQLLAPKEATLAESQLLAQSLSESIIQMKAEFSTKKTIATEMNDNTYFGKTSALVHTNSEARQNNTQANVVLSQDTSPAIMTHIELFGLGTKLAALGAGHMLTSVQPVLSSYMLHYQIAPEYFTQYAQVNTYRVFFRNKYYLFRFEDQKVTNFLEDYYDRY